MGILDNFRPRRTDLTPVAKARPQVADDMQQASLDQGMGSDMPLGPGQAISPAFGYNQHPRSMDYMAGRNIGTRPRNGERISFPTIRDFVDSYDVAQACITHRIDSIRSLKWTIVPKDGVEEDLTRTIALATELMEMPDHETPFAGWFNKFAWDTLTFDAGCLYKLRNNAGQIIGLLPIDGTTIAPLLDGWGGRPKGDAAAYTQIIQGRVTEWYRADELVYTPYRPRTNSPYGLSPIESVLVNASSDIKLQLHFLRNYTAGNIPDMFGILPEDMTPQQREEWQKSWDTLMAGDEDAKSQIKWVPGGTNFKELTANKDFDKDLAEWFLRKTCAAFHMAPQELGYVSDVNRSNGETQENVQQRVGDLPLIEHFEGIITRFLQKDLGAPIKFEFERGAEQEDRLQTAQSDQIYVDMGAVSVSDIAEKRFGIVDEQTVPRFYFSHTLGAVPLSSLFTQSGPVDQETGEPADGSTVHAVQAQQQVIAPPAPAAAAAAPVAKAEADVADGRHGSEADTFRKFVANNIRKGKWRNFHFATVDAVAEHRLNLFGYAEFRKAEGETILAAGVAVRAQDTGRVLMLQRGLGDNEGGKLEFPGGCIEPGEQPIDAAWREWQEEVGLILPHGVLTGQWVSTNGVYAGFVWTIEQESMIAPRSEHGGLNPDDPDGDMPETVLWVAPEDLQGNVLIRTELASDLGPALSGIYNLDPAMEDDVVERIEDDPDLTVREAVNMSTEFLAGGDAAPLAKGWRDQPNQTPQHEYDLPLVDHYTPRVKSALKAWTDTLGIPDLIAHFSARLTKDDASSADLAASLRQNMAGAAGGSTLTAVLGDLYGSGYTAGAHAGSRQIPGASEPGISGDIDWDAWTPGDGAAASAAADGGLADLLNARDLIIQGIEDTQLDILGNLIADGLGAGDSVATITGAIEDMLGSRAEMIAQTETARAVTAGSVTTYAENGITLGDLVTADGADALCSDIASQNPHTLDDLSWQPPLHPWCRCSVSPAVPGVTDLQE